MPSTRRQKAKARKSREMDMMSDLDNLDIMLNDKKGNAEQMLNYAKKGMGMIITCKRTSTNIER